MRAVSGPLIFDATERAKSIPAVTPPPVILFRSMTTRSATGSAPNNDSRSREPVRGRTVSFEETSGAKDKSACTDGGHVSSMKSLLAYKVNMRVFFHDGTYA